MNPGSGGAALALATIALALAACTTSASPSNGADPATSAPTAGNGDGADRIAFGRWEPDEDRSVPPAMWTSNPDGSDPLPVGDQRGWYMEWSPDHTHLIFDFVDSAGNEQIGTVKPDGGDFTQLSTGSGFYADPAYSPDGAVIVFSRSAVPESDPAFSVQLWVMDADGGNPRALMSPEDAGQDWEPVFSPDGSTIVFTREVADEGGTVSATHVVNADGSGVKAITAFDDYVEHPRWSPDGTTIIYNIETHENGSDAPPNGIWTVPAAGGESTMLLPTKDNLLPFKPDYSPDGSEILFGCGNRATGNEDLCIMKADGTDIRVIVATPEIENHGIWR